MNNSEKILRMLRKHFVPGVAPFFAHTRQATGKYPGSDRRNTLQPVSGCWEIVDTEKRGRLLCYVERWPDGNLLNRWRYARVGARGERVYLDGERCLPVERVHALGLNPRRLP